MEQVSLFIRCHRCTNKPATVACDICEARRCYECDILSHSNEANREHKRRIVSFHELSQSNFHFQDKFYTPEVTPRSEFYTTSRSMKSLVQQEAPCSDHKTQRSTNIEQPQEKLISSLQTQIHHLKTQLDANQSATQNILNSSRIPPKSEVSSFSPQKQPSVQRSNLQSGNVRTIQQMEHELLTKEAEATRYRNEIQRSQAKNLESSSDLHLQLEHLQQQLQNYQLQYEHLQNHEIYAVKQEVAKTAQNYENQMNQIQTEKVQSIEVLQNKLQLQQQQISTLEKHINEERQKASYASSALEDEVKNLKRSLKHCEKQGQTQQFDIEHSRKSLEQIQKENKQLNKTNHSLESHNMRLQREREELQESVNRLEKLVYGMKK